MDCKKYSTWVAISLLSLAATIARADEFAEKGREIFKKYQHAVVTVQVVIKASGPGGRSSESKTDITGTVVDPSGLTVVALSSCDPAEMYRRLYEESKIEVEVSDIKILLDDGTELSSEIVLRDKDLDLAFIRPKTKPASPMTAVDLSSGGAAQVLDPMVSLNRLNKAAGRTYSASYERISGVVQKPRTFYIPDSSMSNTSSGSPAFLLDGKFLGVFVMRVVSAAGGTANSRQNITSIILPAEDILKAAKQAPEAKGESDKKEEAKPATEKADSK